HDQGPQIAQLAPPGAALPEGRAALPIRGRGPERAHVEGQRPPLGLAERREAGHGGALDAESDRVVEAEEAVLAHARLIREVGGRGVQPLRGGAVAAAGGAVADRAVGGEVGGGGGEIGDLAGGDAHVVEIDDATAQVAGDGRDLVARALVPDGGEEPGGGGLERGALGAGGGPADQAAHRGRELDLLGVLALIEHLAVLDRAGIVDGQVVERVQDGREGIGLGGGGRRGESESAGGGADQSAGGGADQSAGGGADQSAGGGADQED